MEKEGHELISTVVGESYTSSFLFNEKESIFTLPFLVRVVGRLHVLDKYS